MREGRLITVLLDLVKISEDSCQAVIMWNSRGEKASRADIMQINAQQNRVLLLYVYVLVLMNK